MATARIRSILLLYVGRCGGRAGWSHEARICAWSKTQRNGSGTTGVVDRDQVVDKAFKDERSTRYIIEPALVALEVLVKAEPADVAPKVPI